MAHNLHGRMADAAWQMTEWHMAKSQMLHGKWLYGRCLCGCIAHGSQMHRECQPLHTLAGMQCWQATTKHTKANGMQTDDSWLSEVSLHKNLLSSRGKVNALLQIFLRSCMCLAGLHTGRYIGKHAGKQIGKHTIQASIQQHGLHTFCHTACRACYS